MIRIVACGVGNIRAFLNAYTAMNIAVGVATRAADLADANHILLPGVGSFGWAMSRLTASGMRDALDELVLVKGRPVLAVCVGMHILGRASEEGSGTGLGWIDATVRKFTVDNGAVRRMPLPHMGWNDVTVRHDTDLFRGLEPDARFYFLHSYCVVARNSDVVLATSEYSGTFASAIQQRNIYGVQFHPEKSHAWGERVLRNFACS